MEITVCILMLQYKNHTVSLCGDCLSQASNFYTYLTLSHCYHHHFNYLMNLGQYFFFKTWSVKLIKLIQ